MGSQVARLIADLEEEKAVSLVRESLDAGADPLSLVEECRAGMSEVGERYERGEYFLSDLVMSSEIFRSAIALIEPNLQGGLAASSVGQAIVGTAQGDIHDIGKNIVAAMLRCSGFEVHDLGVDVQPQLFVDKARETGAKLVGISVLLTTSFATLKQTVEALRSLGPVKVLIGGGPVNEMVCQHVGADGWGKDAMQAVALFQKLSGTVR